MKIMVERLIVTKRESTLELWVSELGALDQISDKEAAK